MPIENINRSNVTSFAFSIECFRFDTESFPHPSKLEILSVSQGSLFQNGQESIFSYEIGSGSIEVLTTLLSSSSPSVSGTGDLIHIEVKSLQSGSASISFNGSDVFRDPDNNDITIIEKINGRVDVE